MLIISIAGSIFFLLSLFTFMMWIRSSYTEYCHTEDLKEAIEKQKNEIQRAKNFFREKYNSDFDHTIWENLRIKIEFIMNLIDKKEGLYEVQLEYYKKLYDMLYETEHRLQTKFDDINYIVSPLNNLINELVEEHIAFLKKMTDEGL